MNTNLSAQGGQIGHQIMGAAPSPGDDYEPVIGKDQQTIRCVRACEAEAAAKTASDYSHIVWAYGVIWAIFAAYGAMLWHRSSRQRVEIADLDRRLRGD